MPERMTQTQLIKTMAFFTLRFAPSLPGVCLVAWRLTPSMPDADQGARLGQRRCAPAQ